MSDAAGDAAGVGTEVAEVDACMGGRDVATNARPDAGVDVDSSSAASIVAMDDMVVGGGCALATVALAIASAGICTSSSQLFESRGDSVISDKTVAEGDTAAAAGLASDSEALDCTIAAAAADLSFFLDLRENMPKRERQLVERAKR